MNNRYLTEGLNDLLELTDMLREAQDRFVSELIHSSFYLALDEKMNPIRLSINNNDYAFIFTSPEEFDKTYPSEDVPSMDIELSSLMDIIGLYKLDGLILNVSSQNFYLTKKFLKGLSDLPSNITLSSEAYSTEELKRLRKSIDNGHVEDFIRNPNNYIEFFEMMSSAVLFAVVESESDMDILEHDGIVDTFGLDTKLDYYAHRQNVVLFTSEDKAKRIKTSKFRYLSLVNFATLVHYAIKNEFEGITINPNEENYVVPVDVLIRNWALINRTCWDERMVSAGHNLFQI